MPRTDRGHESNKYYSRHAGVYRTPKADVFISLPRTDNTQIEYTR